MSIALEPTIFDYDDHWTSGVIFTGWQHSYIDRDQRYTIHVVTGDTSTDTIRINARIEKPDNLVKNWGHADVPLIGSRYSLSAILESLREGLRPLNFTLPD